MARRRPAPPPAPVAPDETRPYPDVTYPLMLLPLGVDATSRAARIMGMVSVVVGLGVFMVLVPMVNVAVQTVAASLTGVTTPLSDFVAAGGRFEHVWGLVGAHLGLGAMTLAILGIVRYLHRRNPGWLWSVSPGIRWRYLLACLLLAVPLFSIGLVVSGLTGLNPQPGWGWWLLAIVLTGPLQAVAEEVVFRGYLMQALGMAVRSETFAVVISALLFAIFHGTQNLWLFGSRLAFGLLAGYLVVRTGGLEAPIAAHIVNNLLAFGAAVLMSSVAEVRAVQQIGWLETTRDLLVYGAFTAAALWIAVRMRVPRLTPGLSRGGPVR